MTQAQKMCISPLFHLSSSTFLFHYLEHIHTLPIYQKVCLFKKLIGWSASLKNIINEVFSLPVKTIQQCKQPNLKEDISPEEYTKLSIKLGVCFKLMQAK